MGRAANYFKRPTSRQIGIPAKAGTRPVFNNLSPTLIIKMLSFKRIKGTMQVNLYIKNLTINTLPQKYIELFVQLF